MSRRFDHTGVLKQIRELVSVVEAAPGQRDRAHDRLVGVIAEERGRGGSGPAVRAVYVIEGSVGSRPTGLGPWHRLRVGAALATLIAIAVVGSVLLRPTPSSAMVNVYEALTTLPPEEFGEAVVVRTWTEQRIASGGLAEGVTTAVLQEVATVERVAIDGIVERTETFGEFVLLDPTAAEHVDVLREALDVGKTITTVFPHDPTLTEMESLLADTAEEFVANLEKIYSQHDETSLPFAVYVVEWVDTFYLVTVPTSRQRAAMMAALDSLPGVFPIGTDAAAAVAAERVGDVTDRYELHFNEEGWLVEMAWVAVDGYPSAGIPPNTRNVTWLEPPRAVP